MATANNDKIQAKFSATWQLFMCVLRITVNPNSVHEHKFICKRVIFVHYTNIADAMDGFQFTDFYLIRLAYVSDFIASFISI